MGSSCMSCRKRGTGTLILTLPVENKNKASVPNEFFHLQGSSNQKDGVSDEAQVIIKGLVRTETMNMIAKPEQVPKEQNKKYSAQRKKENCKDDIGVFIDFTSKQNLIQQEEQNLETLKKEVKSESPKDQLLRRTATPCFTSNEIGKNKINNIKKFQEEIVEDNSSSQGEKEATNEVESPKQQINKSVNSAQELTMGQLGIADFPMEESKILLSKRSSPSLKEKITGTFPLDEESKGLISSNENGIEETKADTSTKLPNRLGIPPIKDSKRIIKVDNSKKYKPINVLKKAVKAGISYLLMELY